MWKEDFRVWISCWMDIIAVVFDHWKFFFSVSDPRSSGHSHTLSDFLPFAPQEWQHTHSCTFMCYRCSFRSPGLNPTTFHITTATRAAQEKNLSLIFESGDRYYFTSNGLKLSIDFIIIHVSISKCVSRATGRVETRSRFKHKCIWKPERCIRKMKPRWNQITVTDEAKLRLHQT